MSRELGEAAYLGYLVGSEGRSLVSGVELPPWDQLGPEIRSAWRAAADAVAIHLAAPRCKWHPGCVFGANHHGDCRNHSGGEIR